LYLLNGRRETRLIFNEALTSAPEQSQLFSISRRYDKVLGHLVSEEQTTLFFADKKENAIHYQLFENGAQVPVQGTLESVDISNETIIGSFNKGGRFYILTVPKRSSVVKNYAFTSHENFRVTEYDLSDVDLGNPKENLHSILFSDRVGVYSNWELDIPCIPGEGGSVLKDASRPIKIYPFENEAIITLDHEYNKTILIRIFLNSRFSEVDYFNYPMLSDFVYSFNSYYLNDRLYQMVTTSKEMSLTVFQVSTGESLKDIQINKGDEIWFRNTPMFLNKTSNLSGEKRLEITETKEILKRLTKFELGLSVREVSDRLELKVGVYDEVRRKFSLPIAELGTIFLDISLYETLNKEYYFKSMFSLGLQHLSGEEVTLDYYEQIEGISEMDFMAEFDVPFNGKIIYGYFDKKSRRFNLFQLNDQ
jgi:hypothetical protein